MSAEYSLSLFRRLPLKVVNVICTQYGQTLSEFDGTAEREKTIGDFAETSDGWASMMAVENTRGHLA